MELVSIIMPAFNSAEHIQEAINSVLVQTYVSWELIVINDGSTDHTASVVEAFDDPRIILESRPNLGVSVARNRGLELAKGDWVAFLDADDIWAPFKLEHQMARLSGEKVRPGLIYSDYLEFNEKGSWPAKPLKNFPHFRREGMIFDQLIQHNFIGTLSVLADKQSVLEVGGFDTNLKGPEDWDLWIKISETLAKYYSGDPREVLKEAKYNVIEILENLQNVKKSLFPYLGGKKLSNYWLFILNKFTDVKLKNIAMLSVIPDTHVLQSTVKLGLHNGAVTAEIADKLWRDLLTTLKTSFNE